MERHARDAGQGSGQEPESWNKPRQKNRELTVTIYKILHHVQAFGTNK